MAAAAPLTADLEAGLRRLKLASMRRVAPELLVTAKTQRWSPEELLRALVETEIAARDASNTQLRSKQACFPTTKTVEGFDLGASSIPAQTWAYLTSLEWVDAKENLTLIGPAGTGKSHTLIALGHAAVDRACGSGTSPPPNSSRTFTAAWPTTASGGSSTPCYATT